MKNNILLSAIILAASSLYAPSATGQTVTPAMTTTLSTPADYNTNIRLQAGRLTSIGNVQNSATLTKFKNLGLSFDVSLSDEDMCGTNKKTDAQLKTLFESMQAAISSSGAEIWGIHLPYSTAGESAIDDNNDTNRANAVAYQNKLIDYCVKYLNPKVIVTHPGKTSTYPTKYTSATSTTEDNYFNRRKWSRESVVKMQQQLDKSNSAYGGNAILCVENCMRQTTFDALAALDYLDYPGLEKVKICLDTGHALIPHNGDYLDMDKKTGTSLKTAVREGDVVTMLRLLGDKLGTLHIQQNHGLIGRIQTTEGYSSDTHLEPFNGGLIDWGKFYYVLIKEIGYRGCFLYEVSYQTEYKGTTSTITSVSNNYKNVILPAYDEYLQNNPE